MAKNGLQLLARFSLTPNKLGLCGQANIDTKIIDCIKTGKCEGLLSHLEGFKTQLPYLKTLAQVTDKNYLDYEVIEAYWLGNDLLDQFLKTNYFSLYIKCLKQLELPDFFIESIVKHPPKIFIPFHLASILIPLLPMKNLNKFQDQIEKCRISLKQDEGGQKIAVHWETTAKVLTEREAANLAKWTKIVTDSIN